MSAREVVFLALADTRSEGGAVTAGYELGQAYLRASLAQAGVPSRQYIDAAPGSLQRLVRRLVAQEPRLLVLYAGLQAPPLVRWVAGGVAQAAPGVALALSGVGADEHDRILKASPAVALCVADGAEAAFTAFAASSGSADAAPLPYGLTVQGRTGAGADHPRPTAIERLPSPYLTGVIPAKAAAVVGVETDRANPMDADRRRHHRPERIRAELDWIAERTTQRQLVPLIGEVFVADPERALRLCDAFAGADWPQLALRATVDPDLNPRVLAALAESGFAEALIRVNGADEHDPAEIGERVTAIIETLEAAGALARVHLCLPSAGRATAPVEHVIAEIAAVSPGYTFEWRDDRGRPADPPPGLVAPELRASATRQRHAAARGQRLGRLRAMQEGTYADVPGYRENVRDLWWDHTSSPAEHRDWLSGIVGFDSVLFHCVARGEGGADQAAFVLCETVAVERAGERWILDGRESCRVSGYAAVRELAEPRCPLLLTVDGPDDLHAFLGDADVARETGVFSPLLCHPLSTLGDAVDWTGHRADVDTRLLRLVVGAEGALRCWPTGPPLGELGDGFTTLRERARRQRFAADPETRPALRARAWLGQYVSLPRALRRLVGPHPELTTAEGIRAVRVAGFGGRLRYDGPGTASAADPLLIAVGEHRYLFNHRDDRIVRMTPDTALLFEALACTDELTAAEWLCARRGLSIEAAQEGIASVLAMIRSADMLPDRCEAPRPVHVGAGEGGTT